jgi:hypothetical protein
MPPVKTQASCLTLDMKAIKSLVALSKGMVGHVSKESARGICIHDINLDGVPKFDLIVKGISVSGNRWVIDCKIDGFFTGMFARAGSGTIKGKVCEKTKGFCELSSDLKTAEINWLKADQCFGLDDAPIARLFQQGLVVRNVEIGKDEEKMFVLEFQFQEPQQHKSKSK